MWKPLKTHGFPWRKPLGFNDISQVEHQSRADLRPAGAHRRAPNGGAGDAGDAGDASHGRAATSRDGRAAAGADGEGSRGAAWRGESGGDAGETPPVWWYGKHG